MRKILTLVILSTLIACQGAAQVYDRTFDGDNMIYNYEWFFDANEQAKAKALAIAGHAKLVAAADPDDKSRLQMELTGMQNSCRTLVAKYNANAKKQNRSIFKADTPHRLPTELCEP